MAGEYVQAETIADYWKQLKSYHMSASPLFEEIDRETYNSFKRSEREDSDNHLNFERLGKDTLVVDITFYKYLPESKIAYRTHIVDIKGQQEEHYFIIKNSS